MARNHEPKIVVAGSVHMDLIAQANRLPGHGESVVGKEFIKAPGGKGGNQATGLARAGAKVWLVARLGEDEFGRQLKASLQAGGVDTELMAVDGAAATGASTVFVANGDYSSIIVPGAAGLLSPFDIELAARRIGSADALVVQLELGAKISSLAATVAAQSGIEVIFNASPARCRWAELPNSLRRAASTVIVNLQEAGVLAGGNIDPDRVSQVVGELAGRFGVQNLVITMGRHGAAGFLDGEACRQPGFEVAVMDSVGAGDAFLAAFVVARLKGASPRVALERGAAAGALAVGRAGAYDGLPKWREVDEFLAAKGQGG